MDFEYSAKEQEFRDEVRAFIKANLPPAKQRNSAFLANWLTKVREKRWVGFSWPKDAGGGEGTLAEQAILREEMALAKAPPLGTSFMGLAWVGPGIIQYGTPAQKQRFIPGILDSSVSWCTGYSEPNHGSDLASIQTKAIRQGDDYIVNGQKIWTTGAPWADWMILLVRTDFAPKVKHDGITCLLVDMKSPGVDVRPIENMAGDRHFAEVFFTDVKVPVENRLGDEGKGWAVTVSALANERSSIGEVTQMFEKLDTLKDAGEEHTPQRPPRGAATVRATQDRRIRSQNRSDEIQRSAVSDEATERRTAVERNVGQQAASREPRDRHGRLRRVADGPGRPRTERRRRGGRSRQVGEGGPELAERRDWRRHAEHSAQHHCRTHPGIAERRQRLTPQ